MNLSRDMLESDHERNLFRATIELPQKNHMLRILGVTFGLAVVIGGTIGVGIFRTPGIVAANLDSAGLIIAVWVFGGIYALIGARTLSLNSARCCRKRAELMFSPKILRQFFRLCNRVG